MQLAGGLAGANDGQNAVFGSNFVGNFRPRCGFVPVWRQLDLHPFERIKKGIGVVNDFAHLVQSAQVVALVEIVGTVERRLGGGTQHHGHAVVLYQ